MNSMRIWAIVLRHLYPFRFNIGRMMEITFWPFFDLLIFGFFAIYIQRLSGIGLFVAVLLGAVLLWNVFFRIQQGITVPFLMELWSRNLTNIFVSPISVAEYLSGLVIIGLFKIGIVSLLLWGAAVLLYHVNVLSVGIAVVPLVIALILFGWSIGTFTTGVILRYGQSAEVIAWAFAFFLQPFGAIFFPLSVYPPILQKIVWWIPLPHIFEAMRSLYAGQGLPTNHLLWMFGLNVLYLAAAFGFFGLMFEKARQRGYLLKAQD
jgi:ABC-2 type transport system permease protein